MSQRTMRMIGFGMFLGFCGILGWAAAGFTLKAKTALLSGAVCGSTMIAMGWLVGREQGIGRRIGDSLGTLLPLLFSGVFLWRASVSWTAWWQGEPKFFVAFLLSTMAAVGLVTFWALAKPWRQRWTKTSVKSAQPAARVIP